MLWTMYGSRNRCSWGTSLLFHQCPHFRKCINIYQRLRRETQRSLLHVQMSHQIFPILNILSAYLLFIFCWSKLPSLTIYTISVTCVLVSRIVPPNPSSLHWIPKWILKAQIWSCHYEAHNPKYDFFILLIMPSYILTPGSSPIPQAATSPGFLLQPPYSF